MVQLLPSAAELPSTLEMPRPSPVCRPWLGEVMTMGVAFVAPVMSPNVALTLTPWLSTSRRLGNHENPWLLWWRKTLPLPAEVVSTWATNPSPPVRLDQVGLLGAFWLTLPLSWRPPKNALLVE